MDRAESLSDQPLPLGLAFLPQLADQISFLRPLDYDSSFPCAVILLTVFLFLYQKAVLLFSPL
jgi:hypothetical protein